MNVKKQKKIQRAYHLADAYNWLSIQTHGLLSATRLLEKTGMSKWIDCHRTDNIQLSNSVVIRDQKPMPPSALNRCLAQGLTANDWYAFLNGQVFFWIDLQRLERQRLACGTPQYVMTIDAEHLLEKYAAMAAVTPFNTGNARRAAAQRSLASFVPYESWLNSGWSNEAVAFGTKPRLASHNPVELTIRDAVPDIFKYVLDVKLVEAPN